MRIHPREIKYRYDITDDRMGNMLQWSKREGDL